MDLHHAEALDVLAGMETATTDALVTDPPAGISFMGKPWDHDHGGRVEWCRAFAAVFEGCRRVLKPGAHGLVWALPRTAHWTATALEDAGFEIRDVVTHHFGSGFPKSLDVSKAMDAAAGAEREVVGKHPDPRHKYPNTDIRGGRYIGGEAGERESGILTAPATDLSREWAGWGTALKPATEHWILVRAPMSERTVAANVERWGTGAINVDGCRVAHTPGAEGEWGAKNRSDTRSTYGSFADEDGERPCSERNPSGRWPANLILSHAAGCDGTCVAGCPVAKMDRQSGASVSNGGAGRSHNGGGWSRPANEGYAGRPEAGYPGDTGGASRFFYIPKASRAEREEGLEGMPLGEAPGSKRSTPAEGRQNALGRPTTNHHPTVKPVALMRYLCRMVTPKGGTVLDPFMGSGTTGVAAAKERLGFVGVEMDADYFEIAEKRIAVASTQGHLAL